MIFGAFAFCFLPERAKPGWPLPRVRTWPLRVLLVNPGQLGVVLLAGLTWERWLASWSVCHLSQRVPAAAGGQIAYFIATFVFYWWHRLRHEQAWLWRGFHPIQQPRRHHLVGHVVRHL